MLLFLIVVHVFITIALIGIILMQRGEAGGLGAPHSNQGVFTARGSANFLTHLTAILGTVFMVNCVVMTILSSYQAKQKSEIVKNIDQK